MRTHFMRQCAVGLVFTIGNVSVASLCAAEKPTLEAVIKEVRKHEKRYGNIEILAEHEEKSVLDTDFNPARPPRKEESARTVTSDIRAVLVDDRFYSHQLITVKSKRFETRKSTDIAAFDGKSTRTLHVSPKFTFAAIYDKRYQPTVPLMPNTFLIYGWWVPNPLSRFLSVPAEPTETKPRYTWSVLGEERIDGLKTVKLQFETSRDETGMVTLRTLFWLAVDRNYQPVKSVTYTLRFSTKLAHTTNRVKKFEELKPGLWIPTETEAVIFDEMTLLTKGKQVVSFYKRFKLKKATLNPKVDPALFTTVKIPKDADVAEYHGDKIVKKYKQK